MKGTILINAFSGIGEHQACRLREEFSFLGLNVPIVRNVVGKVPTDVDFCVFLDKDLYCAKMLEDSGVRLFNSAKAIEICDDKMLTYLALKGVINQPLTLPSSFCYSKASVGEEELDLIENSLGYPLVLKLNKHSRGEGVFLVRTRDELREKMEEFRTVPHLYQKFISFSSGRDLRVIVVGGKVICAMERVNENDFRSNVEQGGKGYSAEVCTKVEEIAIKVSKILNLEYCGIDFVKDENGEYYVLEVNSNAFFKGIEKASGVNVARAYAKRVLEKMKE